MDQGAAPLAEYNRAGRYGFTPPAHRQGRGVDDRTRSVIGADAFRSDVLASAGLDDRSSGNGFLKRAEELMADAVGAQHAFSSTWCTRRHPKRWKTCGRGTRTPRPHWWSPPPRTGPARTWKTSPGSVMPA